MAAESNSSGFLILVPVASLTRLGHLCLEQRRAGAWGPLGSGFPGSGPCRASLGVGWELERPEAGGSCLTGQMPLGMEVILRRCFLLVEKEGVGGF